MPRTVDYPRTSLRNSQELAGAVDLLGGKCSTQSAADAMKLKLSGNFSALISATAKYGLIESKSGQLTTTPLYRSIKLAYDENEKIEFERKAFFSMILFNKLYDTFKGRPLPISNLSKFLIRELDVEENIATRVNNVIELQNKNVDEEQSTNVEVISANAPESYNENKNSNTSMMEIQDSNEFSFHIVGPGINTKITISEEEDFDILNAVIRKIKKRFSFTENA